MLLEMQKEQSKLNNIGNCITIRLAQVAKEILTAFAGEVASSRKMQKRI